MAKTTIPENESPRETEVRKMLSQLSNMANRSEKTSWHRKMDNIVKLLVVLEPIEDEILDLIKEKKTPLMDDISALREVMTKECVHPYEYLVLDDNNIATCKFCNKRIVMSTK